MLDKFESKDKTNTKKEHSELIMLVLSPTVYL